MTLVRGLSPTETGQTPDAFLQIVDAKCLGSPRAKSLPAHRAR